MVQIEQHYQYHQHSSLEKARRGLCLNLSSSAELTQSATLFEGDIQHSEVTARSLRVLGDVIESRFYEPAALNNKRAKHADPLATVGHDALRFEGFSSCCSIYARLDIFSQGFKARQLSAGTTHVEFGATVKAALAGVYNHSPLSIMLNSASPQLVTKKKALVHKQISLPLRWIKGLAEVQALQTDLQPIFTLNRFRALKLLRQLPSRASKNSVWLECLDNNVVVHHHPYATGIEFNGAERLQLLKSLIPIAQSVSLFADPKGQLTTWVVDFGSSTFTLVLSAEPARGLSGEGQLLSHLANSNDDLVEQVQQLLNQQQYLATDVLSEQLSVTPEAVKSALTILASRGLVGFDAYQQRFFYRRLPFDRNLVEQVHPRLLEARKLLQSQPIKLVLGEQEVITHIASNDATYQVKLRADEQRCTCQWFAQHQGKRGPCKHILAGQMALREYH
ncbi:SWIM zinc finger family protein [Pleionea sp. CnH1-48]|uniref:SWIM zinc finger family protein n=1 Tax=Pleionea sp. CnH1-48 TaxID=2954494 RepID=UPI0020977FFC|nr:SWIM zinc finger family protein [Pleionea sp. CnH1-48]MCO7223473.1 SWIM zinc finger domain-containing protein [Pleionea sp. CnH1-48]